VIAVVRPAEYRAVEPVGGLLVAQEHGVLERDDDRSEGGDGEQEHDVGVDVLGCAGDGCCPGGRSCAVEDACYRAAGWCVAEWRRPDSHGGIPPMSGVPTPDDLVTVRLRTTTAE